MNEYRFLFRLTMEDLYDFTRAMYYVITKSGLRRHWLRQGYYCLGCILIGHGSTK